MAVLKSVLRINNMTPISLSYTHSVWAHLYGAIVSNQLLLHALVPEAGLGQILEQVLVDHLELSGEHTAGVDVAGVRLDGLIVAKNLSGGCGGHRSQQQTVTDPVSVFAAGGKSSPYLLFPTTIFYPHQFQCQKCCVTG